MGEAASGRNKPVLVRAVVNACAVCWQKPQLPRNTQNGYIAKLNTLAQHEARLCVAEARRRARYWSKAPVSLFMWEWDVTWVSNYTHVFHMRRKLGGQAASYAERLRDTYFQPRLTRLAAAGRARAARGPAHACLLAVGTGRTRPPACARVCAPRAAYRLPACAESAKSGAVHSGGVYSTGSTLRFM